MPQSRKRHGHPHQKSADIRASQRTTGHLIWALLVGAFGMIIGYFASGGSVLALLAGAIVGALLGWMLGNKMERDASGK
jgi:hypothetical protein